MKRPSIAVVAALVLALALAACGGGGSSSGTSSSEGSGEVTKAAFVEEADAICAEGEEAVAPFKEDAEELEEVAEPESQENLTKLAELLHGASVQAEIEFEKLRELEPPAADEEEIDKLFTEAEEGSELGVEGAEQLEEGEVEAFSELSKEANRLDASTKAAAQAYGFKVCGQEEE